MPREFTYAAKKEIGKGLKHVQFMALSADSIVVVLVWETKQLVFVQEKYFQSKTQFPLYFSFIKITNWNFYY